MNIEDIELNVRLNFSQMWNALSLLEKQNIVKKELMDGLLKTEDLIEILKSPTRKLGKDYFFNRVGEMTK